MAHRSQHQARPSRSARRAEPRAAHAPGRSPGKHDEILRLQRAIGNRATGALLGGPSDVPALQRKGGRLRGLFKKKPYTLEKYKADLQAAFTTTSVKSLEKKLAKLRTKGKGAGHGWSAIRSVFQGLTGAQKTLVHDTPKLRDACFAFGATVKEKAEVLYYLGGTADWKREAMTAYNISHDDFRESLVRLGVFEAGTAGHKSGPEVDELIEDKLETFVEKGLENRGKITGRIAVVGAADWDVIGLKQYGQGWAQKKNTLNAFVDRGSDPPRVFVNKDRGNAGTAIHEACHMWGDPGRPINSISHDLNEGVTEFFARKVCAQLTPPIPRTVYAKQFAIATKLCATVGEEVVGAAFFDGNVASLSGAMGATRWQNFTDHINAGAYANAEAVLAKVKKGQTEEEGEFSLADLFAG